MKGLRIKGKTGIGFVIEDGMLIGWMRVVWMPVPGRVDRGVVALVKVVLRHSIDNIYRLALEAFETIGIV